MYDALTSFDCYSNCILVFFAVFETFNFPSQFHIQIQSNVNLSYGKMTDRVVSALRTHLLHNYLPGAPRNEVTAALRELALLMEKDAPLLSARKPHRADLVSTITVLAAPKHAGGGPLIKSVNSSRVELALWSTVLPWETSRGLSFISKDLLETGRWGELTTITSSMNSNDNQADADDDDDLAIISKNVAENIQNIATNNSKKGKKGSPAATPLDGTNGMLFVHRPSHPRDIPHFWSGAIQCPLDVAFLSIPTPLEELTATAGLHNTKTGLNPKAAYQCLDQSTPGFGPLDDPLIYGYYLNSNNAKRALLPGEDPANVHNTMPMRVEDVAVLDPFAELEGFNINGDSGSGLVLNDGTYFDGQHMFNDGRTHRCSPKGLNKSTNRNQAMPTPIVTAVLEVRKGLFKDAVRSVQRGKSTAASSSFSSPQSGVTEEDEKVSFSVELGEELMTEMKAKEHLYRDVVETLDRRCAQLLMECEKPVGWAAKKAAQEAAEEEAAAAASALPPPSVRSANLQSWKEGNNASSSSSELASGNPTRLAPSFAGADGTKKSAFYTSMTRYSNASPDLPTYPPVDIEMLTLAFKLSMGVSAIPQLLGRLADDIAHDSQFTEEESEKGGGLWRVKSEDIVTLVELVRNPAVALPSNLCMMILNEAARRDI